ncbi:MAG: PaaI family thioesterase [Coriobacteriia bacterium]|nr:PaaI family thioesterase [Coriobacteriia bacterium]
MLDPIIYEYCQEDVVDIRGFDRLELVDADEGRFVIHAHPGPDCGNNIGTVHGGFLLALVDIAGTGAADTLGHENTTMSSTASFLRPAQVDDAYLEVTGTVLKSGRRVIVTEVEIRRPNNELCVKATVSTAVIGQKITDLPRFASDEK